jgi:hypothetical protein
MDPVEDALFNYEEVDVDESSIQKGKSGVKGQGLRQVEDWKMTV